MSATRIAKRYAKALFDLESTAEARKNVQASLSGVIELFAFAESRKILKSPVMPPALKLDLLRYALDRGNASKILRDFIQFVVEEGRVEILPEIIDEFRTLLERAAGQVRAKVRVAVRLQQDDLANLRSTLGKLFARDVIVLEEEDPTLLGGMVVAADNYVLDLSLKTRLDQLADTTNSLAR